MTTATTTGQKRLEASWGQRVAWVAVAWLSCGFLAWVPFLYVAVRRGLASDWVALGSFVVYEATMIPWMATDTSSDGDGYMGLSIMATMVTGALMLLLAVFDKSTAPAPVMAYGTHPVHQGHPYQQPGYPYGR